MTALETSAPATLLDRAHHDGSPDFVPERPDELGGTATVLLRVPSTLAPATVVLRTVVDGEPQTVEATVDREAGRETWYRASFTVGNPSVRYRWLLYGGRAGYAWLNGRGAVGHEVPDADDFVLSTDPGGPDWHLDSIGYEIFPDRFARGGAAGEVPEWAVERAWDEPPTGRGPETPHELYGGDLVGIEQRLDHVEALGADLLYLTPFFPAGSTHRYDATTFDRVDPLLGGEAALDSLLRAAHARGMRVVGDLTLNHTGNRHEWFPDERELYFFDESLPHGYAAWFGVRTLPKLNWGSPALRARMQAVARRWVDAGLDGWRIDVANMTGRYADADLAHEAARSLRGVVDGDRLLVAEHGYDYRADLGGGGWHGAMNYAGFLRPVWAWLRAAELPEEIERRFWGMPVGLPRLDGHALVGAMAAFRAGLPWPSVQHSWNLLDSHDTPRFRTVAGDRTTHLVGIGLQATLPGVPMVFAGDELGLEGAWGEDARRTMPWDRPASWDADLFAGYGRLLRLRRGSAALRRGGFRLAHVGAEEVVYLRELGEERLLCHAARAPHAPVRLPLDALGAGSLDTLYGGDARVAAGIATLPDDGPAFHVWRIN